MDTHGVPHIVHAMIIAIVLAGLPGLGTAQIHDPNVPPDGWDRFEATWESTTLSITAYNPAQRPDIDPLTRKHVIMVSGKVYRPDANDLVAVTTTHATAWQGFDQDGSEVLFDPNAVVQSPGRTWMLGDRPKPFSIEMHLDPNQACPTLLAELDFTVEALYGQPFLAIDLPVEVTEEWLELTPRYRMRVTEVSLEDEICHIIVKSKATDIAGSGNYPFDPNETWEEKILGSRGAVLRFSDLDVISRAKIIDTGETPSWDGGKISHSSGSDDEGHYSMNEFTLYNCTGTKNLLIRYTIALYPYEFPIPLVLTDVTVPCL